jgi:hypothetical protein
MDRRPQEARTVPHGVHDGGFVVDVKDALAVLDEE